MSAAASTWKDQTIRGPSSHKGPLPSFRTSYSRPWQREMTDTLRQYFIKKYVDAHDPEKMEKKKLERIVQEARGFEKCVFHSSTSRMDYFWTMVRKAQDVRRKREHKYEPVQLLVWI